MVGRGLCMPPRAYVRPWVAESRGGGPLRKSRSETSPRWGNFLYSRSCCCYSQRGTAASVLDEPPKFGQPQYHATACVPILHIPFMLIYLTGGPVPQTGLDGIAIWGWINRIKIGPVCFTFGKSKEFHKLFLQINSKTYAFLHNFLVIVIESSLKHRPDRSLNKNHVRNNNGWNLPGGGQLYRGAKAIIWI